MTTIFPIRVVYHRGTQELEGSATTVRGALRIAAKNQNAFEPCFYAADGTSLYPLTDDNGRTLLGDPENPSVCYA